MKYLIPREPFNISVLRRQMDDMFDNFFPFSASLLESPETGSISVDVIDNGKEYLVKANIPGVSAKDIDVRVTEDAVTLKGSFNKEKTEEKENFVMQERYSGSFLRTIPMTLPVDPDKVKAKFKDGVLELQIPKIAGEKIKGRQIQILEEK